MKKMVLMFPGQGSQYENMGVDFIEKNPSYAHYFTQCSQSLGEDLLAIIGQGSKLNQTEYSQPAIYTLSCALYDYLDHQLSLSKQAGATIGHSLGDYSALYGCGAYTFEKGLELVIKRGRLMAEENERSGGLMAAVLGKTPEQIEQAIKKLKLSVYIANYNHPAQTVISGERDMVQKAIKTMKQNGIKKVIPLKVGVASHCPLMQDISEKLAQYMSRHLHIGEFNIPFYSSTANGLINEGEVQKNLQKQLVQPIRWLDSVMRLLDQGFDTFIEIGPKDVLTKLVKPIAASHGSDVHVYNTENREELFKNLKGDN